MFLLSLLLNASQMFPGKFPHEYVGPGTSREVPSNVTFLYMHRYVQDVDLLGPFCNKVFRTLNHCEKYVQESDILGTLCKNIFRI